MCLGHVWIWCTVEGLQSSTEEELMGAFKLDVLFIINFFCFYLRWEVEAQTNNGLTDLPFASGASRGTTMNSASLVEGKKWMHITPLIRWLMLVTFTPSPVSPVHLKRHDVGRGRGWIRRLSPKNQYCPHLSRPLLCFCLSVYLCACLVLVSVSLSVFMAVCLTACLLSFPPFLYVSTCLLVCLFVCLSGCLSLYHCL